MMDCLVPVGDGNIRVHTSEEDPDFVLVDVPRKRVALSPDAVMALIQGLGDQYREFCDRQPPTLADNYTEPF